MSSKPARVLRRIGLIVAGVIGAILCYCVCQSVFAGYPQYGTDVLTYIGVTFVAATGGIAWIIDHRRIHDDD